MSGAPFATNVRRMKALGRQFPPRRSRRTQAPEIGGWLIIMITVGVIVGAIL